MNKIFLYLYPIKEFTQMFLLHDDKLYDDWNVIRPFPIMNECIQKRYRDSGYQVVFAIYPDREIYGIQTSRNDQIIYTDISFKETSGYDENNRQKETFQYPSEEFLIQQLGKIDNIIIGGYHFCSCVRRMAEYCYKNNIDTLVDLDLTELFFQLYQQKNYFDITNYSPERYKKYWIQTELQYGGSKELYENQFQELYQNPIYHFYDEETPKCKRYS